jgi:bacteriocin biosynthesis cyclodehydratase domain-containing protein
MKLELIPGDARLRPTRLACIETPDGIVLKRGRVEVEIAGEGAAEVVQAVLATAAERPVTREEICDRFAAPDRPAVEQLVRQLEARRLLVPADADEPAPGEPEEPLEIFYWHFGERQARVDERLNERSLAIVGVNHVSRQLVASLAAAGVDKYDVIDYPLLCNLRLFGDRGALSGDEWPPAAKTPLNYSDWVETLDPDALGCLVVTSDFGGLHLLRRWNEFCVRRNCHFLPVVLQDLIGYVGPLVVPGQTACFECFCLRQDSHQDDPRLRRTVEAAAFEGQGVAGFHPAMASVLGSLAAFELTRFYGGWMSSRLAGTLIEANLVATQLTARRVLKLPRCPVCSPLNRRSAVTPNKSSFMPGHEVV